MALYFFDCFDGRETHRDRHGVELADGDEVADHGASLAHHLLGECLGGSGSGATAVTVKVRSAGGAQVYVAHCSFHGMRVPVPADGG